jgi:predicted nucleic acid-binding protein
VILLDSNVVIEATRPELADQFAWMKTMTVVVSAISYVEVLGYHRLDSETRERLEGFFAATPILSVDQPVLRRAVQLRQLRKLGLGDALIAATALVHGLALATRNTADFAWIDGLTLADPLAG